MTDSFMGYGSPQALEDAIKEGEGPDFMVYGEGLLYASVCSSLPQEEVEARMAARPCGTSMGWTISEAEEFADGQSNPRPCDTDPETRKHYLFDA